MKKAIYFLFMYIFTLPVLGQNISDFGYKNTEALGERPLLVIMLEFSGIKFKSEHTANYYEELFFSTDKPNIAGYGGFYYQNSNARFHFKNAGVLGPFQNIDEPNSQLVVGNQFRHLGNAIKLAHQNGFDFSQYDQNNDGVITNDELVVYVIEAKKGREDNFATTNPRWQPADENIIDGYNFVRLEGYVHSPDLAQPTGTAQLNSWWSRERGDNLASSNTTWSGNSGDRRDPDYQYVRNEGYVISRSDTQPEGTIPLHSWWSPSREDNYITSNPSWHGEEGDVKHLDYIYVRKEGYVFSPELQQPPGTIPLYSWWSDRIDSAGGGVNRLTLPTVISAGNTRVSLSVAASGESSNAATIAHELGHAIGQGWEAYGADANNLRYTVMSLAPGGPNEFSLWNFDPFAKMAFGWQKPKILNSSDQTQLKLWASELSATSSNKSYILYDPAKGENEFFMLEYRMKSSMDDSGMYKPLYNWWNRHREDNFATTYSGWNAQKISHKDDYSYFRMEGLVYALDDSRPSSTIPLHSWWSPTRKDNFLTSNPSWSGEAGDSKIPDYKFVRTEGYIHSPDLPQPQETVPLYSWWNPEREDNYITSDPAWNPNIIEEDQKNGYRFVRLEGYLNNLPVFNYDKDIPDEGLAIWHVLLDRKKIPRVIPGVNLSIPPNKIELTSWYSLARGDNYTTTKPEWNWKTNESKHPDYELVRTFAYIDAISTGDDTVPLYSWWSPSREDNFITTNPNWHGERGDVKHPDYQFVRKEGYIISPDLPQPENSSALYSWWNPTTKDNYLTDNPDWSGETETQKSGYIFSRKEGYVKDIVDKIDSALYLIPPSGKKGQPLQNNGLWDASDGRKTIEWHDGSAAFKVKVGPRNEKDPVIIVEIN